jgi:steroid 5-alpha reductase family enzyme
MGFGYLGVLLIVSAALCAVGFYRYVYFLSIGYGFAVAGIGVTLAVMSAAGLFHAQIQHILLFVLLIVYGVRLSGFLIVRETRNASYRKVLKEAAGSEAHVPFFGKVAIWVCVSVLYVGQTSAVYFRLYNGGRTSAIAWVAIAICAAALVLESEADRQKSQQKKLHPERVAMDGLYRFVRCPNYFGEILFWTGIFLSGLDILQGWGQWLTAVLAYLCIVYVMFNGAQRLERRQMSRYADDREYRAYADRTPIIIPLLPLYHLNPVAGAAPKERKEQ